MMDNSKFAFVVLIFVLEGVETMWAMGNYLLDSTGPQCFQIFVLEGLEQGLVPQSARWISSAPFLTTESDKGDIGFAQKRDHRFGD